MELMKRIKFNGHNTFVQKHLQLQQLHDCTYNSFYTRNYNYIFETADTTAKIF